MDEVIGQRLKKLREMHGYTQKQVADYLGMDQSNLSKLERGVRSIMFSTLNQLSHLYGCNHEYILGQSDEYEKPDFSFRSDEEIDLNAIAKMNQIMDYLSLLNRIEKE